MYYINRKAYVTCYTYNTHNTYITHGKEREKMKNIIMISNQKGGVGKTTTALELCNLFGEKYKVLGIDLDSQRNFSMYAGAKLEEVPTVNEVLNAEILLEDAVQHLEKFDILIGSKSLSEAAKSFGEPDDIYLLSDVLEDLNKYDYVFIDNAPARSPLLYMSYIASNYIIAPAECDDGALEGLRELGTDIARFQKRNQTNVKMLGLLLNKTENTVMHNLAYEEMKEIGKELGCEPFNTCIRKSIAVTEAKAARESINEYAKGNNSAADYRRLMKEIEKRIKKNERE